MKMTVGKKIFGGFALLLILLLVVGLFGVNQMNRLYKQAEEMNVSWMPGVSTSKEIESLTQEIVSKMFLVVVESDVQRATELTKQIDEHFKQIDTEMAAYEATILDELYPEDRHNFEELKKEISGLKAAIEENKKLAADVNLEAGVGSRIGEVNNMIKSLTDRLRASNEILDKVTKFNDDGAVRLAKLAAETNESARGVIFTVIAAAILIGLVMAYLIARNISRPMIQASEALGRVAAGDLTVEPLKVKSRDEIGQLAEAFNRMTADMNAMVSQIKVSSEMVAASAEQLLASAEQSSKAAESVADGSQEASDYTEKQMQSVEELFNALSEVSAGMQQISGNGEIMLTMVRETNELSDRGGRAVQAIAEQMNEINQTSEESSRMIRMLGEQSKQIGNIVTLITGIANQTNLLALNAAIEAARAGEHGKGFAVVAGEVRKLAEQSVQSAAQITSLVESIQRDTDKVILSVERGTDKVYEGIRKAEDVRDAFTEIKESIQTVSVKVEEVTHSVEDMTASSEEMTATIETVSTASEQIATASQTNAAASQQQLASMQEISASSQSLAHLAEELNEVLARFKTNK
ncbi:methyl-accepting chemotaxis protein [Paenibacillus mucilaginosus]|uniref:Putative methyl-accepting chemotaxis protein n=2 Tax=Paenibacillus mucilaginosus TaxID=61624 RepID=F8FPZ6_PAEMK|nr:putative methyl-accepting chemotaxis protein [Paenibacillus mucilaginosus KNP414]WDM28157.1 methyl-accepting chemotaxis protein [Paenibacillus mucilaginosus]